MPKTYPRRTRVLWLTGGVVVCGTQFVSFNRPPTPAERFEQVVGFPPPADVTGLNATAKPFLSCDFVEITLEFNASPATIARIRSQSSAHARMLSNSPTLAETRFDHWPHGTFARQTVTLEYRPHTGATRLEFVGID